MKLLIAILVLAGASFGQSVFRVQKFCEVGGQKVITQGLNSVTNIQRSFPKCTVTVYLTGTTTIAAVYSDNLGPPTPLANPFTANVDGSWGFYASTASCYDVVTSGGNPGDTFPQPFTYSNICVGGGGGGTGVNPGTPYQVTRYDPTGVNIQDSTGSDNPANGPTRWVQGLSVEGNAGYRMFVNSSAGTTTNLLVCRDASVTSITEVTTCPVSSNSVFGLADNGSGTTGSVRVAMTGFHSCVFDGQTVVGDWAVPSATNAGQCSDGGATKPTTQQVLGHITTLNTGAATLATVDLWTGDTISGGGATVAIAPCTIAGCFAYYTTPNSIGGDNHTNLDGSGNGQLASLGLTDLTHSGFWYQQAGPALPSLTGLNRFYFAVNTAFGTTYGLEPWDNAPTVGHCVDIATGDAAGWIKLHDAGAACGTGSGATIQTNSVNNTSQVLLNFTNDVGPMGTTTIFSNPSGGVEKLTVTANTLNTPAAPTLTTNGSAGSTTISYKIVGCQDGPVCAFHSPASTIATIATANGTLTSSNSVNLTAYADTLYGYRCYNVYRTATNGTSPTTTGLIANCAWKSIIDTGLAGDSTTPPATNTTQLFTWPIPSSCGITPGQPIGVDAPPCSPKAADDEFTSTFGAPGDVNNPFWTWINQGSCTASWTNGMLKMSCPSGASSHALHCLVHAAPATPYTFDMMGWWGQIATGTQSGRIYRTLALRESATGKIVTIGGYTSNTDSAINQVLIGKWTSATVNSSFGYQSWSGLLSQPEEFSVQNDGANTVYQHSPDGVTYFQALSEAKNAFFTTAPDQYGICLDPLLGVAAMDVDRVRQTQ